MSFNLHKNIVGTKARPWLVDIWEPDKESFRETDFGPNRLSSKIHILEHIIDKTDLKIPMNLQQLKVFQSAASGGSFTRASENLLLSQSTVSQHIKQLETELHCQLFLRVGKRVLLTDAGRLLMEHCGKIFNDIRNAEMALQELSGLQRGHLRLGTGVTMLTYILPPVLKAFTSKFPGIELTVFTGTTALVTQFVRSQTIDLGVVTLAVSSRDLNEVELFTEELVVVVSASDAGTGKKHITLDELSSLPLILYEKQTVLRSIIDQYLSEIQVVPRTIMEIGNVEGIKSLVTAGLGASILPENAVRKEEKEGTLRLLRFEKRVPHRRLGLITLRSSFLPKAVREMAKLIVSSLGKSERP